MTNPARPAPERAVKALVVRVPTTGYTFAHEAAGTSHCYGDQEGWIVLAPHAEPPVTADQHERELREAFYAGWLEGVASADDDPEDMRRGFAEWKARER